MVHGCCGKFTNPPKLYVRCCFYVQKVCDLQMINSLWEGKSLLSVKENEI